MSGLFNSTSSIINITDMANNIDANWKINMANVADDEEKGYRLKRQGNGEG